MKLAHKKRGNIPSQRPQGLPVRPSLRLNDRPYDGRSQGDSLDSLALLNTTIPLVHDKGLFGGRVTSSLSLVCHGVISIPSPLASHQGKGSRVRDLRESGFVAASAPSSPALLPRGGEGSQSVLRMGVALCAPGQYPNGRTRLRPSQCVPIYQRDGQFHLLAIAFTTSETERLQLKKRLGLASQFLESRRYKTDAST